MRARFHDTLLNTNETATTFKTRQIDVDHTLDRNEVNRQPALEVSSAPAVIEIDVAEITGSFIELDAKLRAAICSGEFNREVIAVETFFEALHGHLGSQLDLNRVHSFAEAIDERR